MISRSSAARPARPSGSGKHAAGQKRRLREAGVLAWPHQSRKGGRQHLKVGRLKRVQGQHPSITFKWFPQIKKQSDVRSAAIPYYIPDDLFNDVGACFLSVAACSENENQSKQLQQNNPQRPFKTQSYRSITPPRGFRPSLSK